MNWKRFMRTAATPAARRTRFRPRLDLLEDRTLLTVATFYLDQAGSRLNLSGDVSGNPISQQGTGSLSTTYQGSIEADYDLQAGTISLTPNTDALADISGNWQPRADGSGGSAPANYGGRVNFLGTAYAAVRNLEVTAFDTDPAPLSDLGGGGYYFPSNETLYVYNGSAAYNHPIAGHGSTSLADQSTTNQGDGGLLYDLGGGLLYLDLSINVTLSFSISGIQAHLNIRGEIQGYTFPGNGGPDGGAAPGTGVDVAAGQVLLASALPPAAVPLPGGAGTLSALLTVPRTDLTGTLAAVATGTDSPVAHTHGPAPAADTLAVPFDLAWSPNWSL